MTSSPTPSTTSPGSGHLVLTSPLTGRSKFSKLTASYPLKLLSPSPLPSTPRNLGTCYVLAYGGGLVAGDEISLEIVVEHSAGLLLLTQGSTKVFRTRPGLRPLSLGPPRSISTSTSPSKTLQRTHITVQPNAFLLLLPCAVQPYASSSYHQAQRVHLVDRTASVILLDWFTSGRSGRTGDKSEEWDFERYSSLNEVVLGGKVIMRERTVLENDNKKENHDLSDPPSPSSHASSPSLASRMHPYKTYATLLITGPYFLPLLRALQSLSTHPSQTAFQSPHPNPQLLYSYSPLEDGHAGILRVAGAGTEGVGEFVRGVLERGDVDGLVGKGLWERVW